MKLTGQFFKNKNNKTSNSFDEIVENSEADRELSSNVKRNEDALKEIFSSSIDFTINEIIMAGKKGLVVYLNSMVNTERVYEEVKGTVIQLSSKEDISFSHIQKSYFTDQKSFFVKTYHECVWNILNGAVIVFLDSYKEALAIEVNGFETRSITEPSTQTVIRGPKDGFVESIQTNMSLIRRRIKNPRLTFEQFIVGSESRTTVVIASVKGIMNEETLKEIKTRIEQSDVPAILDSGNIEELISDNIYTPFPLIFNSERPDTIAANLMEGKAAILVDGSPFVLLAPCVFSDFFQTAEDYYQPFFMASFLRIIRYISFMIALIMPSLYVAITTYHVGLLPTPLLISIQSQREGVPFPAVIEILIMEFAFEVLREAGVRMPRVVGQTVSIVGALVIGQAAVEAGIVSNVLVIIVAFTAISSFVTPIYKFSIATRILRFVLILGASAMGLYAILLLLVIMVAHLSSLKSFGIPYLTPIAPLSPDNQDDVFIRFPIGANKKRPTYLKPKMENKMVKQGGNKK
ncbi:spore germination protein [Metabacillus fastidiosus]|uniref:spore germination protein n=1 Tax=Metabacillus fastidiosus TaxID=1458 RepID=UPI002DB62448|nr:spore germination protein [Metabacillus fastidiosus]MEC2075942.1 spore germination protein [Metabacillus fastidiosus]